MQIAVFVIGKSGIFFKECCWFSLAKLKKENSLDTVLKTVNREAQIVQYLSVVATDADCCCLSPQDKTPKNFIKFLSDYL